MLTKRIIPCLDVDRGRVVKGINFLQLRDAGDPVEVARRYEQDGADELVFLDISASHEGREIMLDVVRRVSEEIFMPFTVGGGIRTLEDATRLIQAGAEKVSINSAAVKDPELVTQVSRKFGRCATVVNIDPRRVRKPRPPLSPWGEGCSSPPPPAPLPPVASGGAGGPGHLRLPFEAGADAALAASIFHYNEYGIPATKRYLAERGVPVRISG